MEELLRIVIWPAVTLFVIDRVFLFGSVLVVLMNKERIDD